MTYQTAAASLEFGDTINLNGNTYTVYDAGWDEVTVQDANGAAFLVDPAQTVEVVSCLIF